MRYPFINSSFLDGFSELVIERGGLPGPLYEAAQLNPDAAGRMDTLIPFDRQNLLLDLAAKELDFPYLGLELARRQTIAIYGPLASMVVASNNLGEALKIFISHIQLRVQTVKLHLTLQGDSAEFSIVSDFEQVADSVRYQDHGLALVHNLVRTLVGHPLSPRGAYFRHSEIGDPDYYSRYFSCPVAFNCENLAITFDASILEQPIAASARTIPVRLRQHLEDRHQNNFVAQIKHCITLLLVREECRVETVAQAIGYSKRSLQRRLQEHNTSFQSLVDSVRCQQAETYINHPYYRLTDIAAVLGYSELSAFTRSFKRWYGLSPQQWRSRNRPLN